MTARGKITLWLTAAAVTCLIGGLGVWRDPLRQALTRLTAPPSPVVARVFNCPITRSQLDRALSARLWRDGQSCEALTPDARHHARAAALDELIDDELLRVKAAESTPVSSAQITARLQQFSSRFESPAALARALKSQGMASECDLRDHLTAHLQQEQYLESRIGLLATPSEEDARRWFDRNQLALALPERIEARHIFLPTLDHPAEEARATLAGALADLTAGRQGFTALAHEISEDPATKDRGGVLGWMTRDRLPNDFAAQVFALADHQPTLVRTHLGWHLVEVTARQPSTHRTYEQAKPEIMAALAAVHRQQLVREFRATLRRYEDAHIVVVDNFWAE